MKLFLLRRSLAGMLCLSFAATVGLAAPAWADKNKNNDTVNLPDFLARGVTNNGKGFGRNPLSGQALDLSSLTPSIGINGKLLKNGATVTIQVGAAARTIQAGDMVTPAELVALYQVLSGGPQNLTLNDSGQAIAGAFSVAALRGAPLQSLVIPTGVSAVGLAGKNPLRVEGLLSTQGSLLGIASTGNRPFFVQAGSIDVGVGGLISTDIPLALVSLIGSNSGPVDITLRSFGDVVNAGTILATGVLKIDTKGSIINNLSGVPPVGTALPSMAGNLGVNLSAKGDIVNSALISSIAGNITATAGRNLIANAGASFQAGTLSPTAALTGVLAPANITSAGAISLSGSTISLADLVTITANGGDVRLQATRGDLTLGSTNVLAANGGNLLLTARGAVTGGLGNTFTARAVGTGTNPSASSGGGIGISSGVSNVANLSAAFNGTPATSPLPSVLGSNVIINNNLGVVQANTSGGGLINLSTSGGAVATLTLNRGVIVFNAAGSEGSVQFDGGAFTVDAFRPVAYREAQAIDSEVIVDTGEGDFVEEEEEQLAAVR